MRLLAYLRAFCLSLSLFLITVSSHECDPYQPLYTQISEDLEPWTSGRLTMPDQKDTVDLCKTKNNWSYICFQLGPDGLKITWIHDNAYGVNWHTLHTQGFFVELSEVFSRYGHELLQALDGSEFNFVLFMGDQNQESLQNLGWQPGLPPYGPNRGRRLPIILSYHRAEGMPLVLIPYSPWLRCNKKPTPLQNQSLNKGVVKAGLSSAYAFDNALLNDKDTPLSRTEWSLRKPVALGRQSLFCPKMKTMSSDGSRLLPCARKHLESLSQNHSDLLDFAFPGKPMEKERRQRLFVPAMNQSQWKYLVMTDGWTIRTRIETHMLTESVILWQVRERMRERKDHLATNQPINPVSYIRTLLYLAIGSNRSSLGSTTYPSTAMRTTS